MTAEPRSIKLARSVLSSKETTDSPTCPTCGSDDPAKAPWLGALHWGDEAADNETGYCPDTFHSTDRGKD